MQYIQNPEFFVDLGHEKITSVSLCYFYFCMGICEGGSAPEEIIPDATFQEVGGVTQPLVFG